LALDRSRIHNQERKEESDELKSHPEESYLVEAHAQLIAVIDVRVFSIFFTAVRFQQLILHHALDISPSCFFNKKNPVFRCF
jgi:hypothetical protein